MHLYHREDVTKGGKPCFQPPAFIARPPVSYVRPAGQAGQACTSPGRSHLCCGARIGEHGVCKQTSTALRDGPCFPPSGVTTQELSQDSSKGNLQ